MKKTVFAILLILAAVSCGNNGAPAPQEPELATRAWQQLQVPGILDGEDAVKFVCDNYWNQLGDTTSRWLCDSLHIAGFDKTIIEQVFANFTMILDNTSIDRARSAMARLARTCTAAASDTTSNLFNRLREIVDSYLFDPNSPVRNEDYYLPFALEMASCEALPEEERAVYDHNAWLCSLNRIGTVASDFRFCDRNGRIHSLHGIKAEYTLLFFSNPGCEACKEIIETLRGSLRVQYLLDSGRLAVVNVYIDEDIEAWYGYMSFYPTEWYNGYDPNYIIRSDELYDVRAIPSLYMLDKNKSVLMKDAPENKIFDFLENL